MLREWFLTSEIELADICQRVLLGESRRLTLRTFYAEAHREELADGPEHADTHDQHDRTSS